MGAAVVYSLCLLASLTCAVLLVRGYRRSPSTLLFWSSICFALLTLNNTLVVTDLLLTPGLDLSVPRLLSSLAAVGVLLYGFIWGADRG